MNRHDSRNDYLRHVAALKARLDPDAALRTAIGGEFVAMGTLEHELLRSLGLEDGDVVVDVGCGSGRLAYQLARYTRLHYIGVDVVPDLVTYAMQVTPRRDWMFAVTDGTAIPAESAAADFVCFFSVFTHIPPEQTYRYLREAKRVLRPGGRVVFSFLEFRIPCHWQQFQVSGDHSNAGQHLNQFLDREAIAVWAERLGLAVELFADGDRPHIPLSHEVQFESGCIMRSRGNLGQSVAVLRVPGDGPGHRPKATTALRDHVAPTGMRARDATEPALFPAVSARGWVGPDAALILGFPVPEGARRVLVRALGRGLAKHCLLDCLSCPHLAIHDQAGQRVAAVQGGPLTPAMAADLAATNAFARFPSAVAGDAVLLLSLKPGVYTAVVTSHEGAGGNVLLEAYPVADPD